MKNRHYRILVLVSVLVVLFWLFWPRTGRVHVNENQISTLNGGSDTSEHTFPRNAPREPAARSPLKSANGQKLTEDTDGLVKLIERRNRPISFYGETVDEDSNPLTGVQISIVVPYLTIDGKSISLTRTSDSRGRFEVHDIEGDAVDIEGMNKHGYELEPTHHGYGPVSGSPESPVIFRLWRNDIRESLETGQKSFPIRPDGTVYVITFSSGTIAKSGGGDLSLWIKYNAQTLPGQISDWLSEVNMTSGGLLEETNDSAMYLAPATGYDRTFQYNQQIKGGQWGSTGEKRFYIMLKSGREYGRMTIELDAPYNRQIPGMIRLSYAINPTGSRILR